MRKPDFTRRVAVTGLGIVSPIGSDVDTVWQHLVDGVSGLDHITYWDPTPYDCQVSGEVRDFDPAAWMNFKEVRRTDKNVVLGVAAAKKAIAHSGLEIDASNRDEIGVYFGSGGGGSRLLMDNRHTWETKGARAVSPFYIANMLPDTASGQIAIETGIRGPNMCIVTACSTGTHNIGEAAELIRRGDVIAVVAGSTESPLHELIHIGFSNMRGMGTPRPGEAEQTISRPFDVTRDGFVLGEGAGAMVLEDLDLGEGAWRHDLRRGGGLRLGGRRMGPDPARGEGRRDPAGAAAGAGALRRTARMDRHDQPARDLHAAGRPPRGRGVLGRLRGADPRDPDQRDEVPDRPSDGRGGRRRGDLHRALDPQPGSAGRAHLPRSGSRDQPQRPGPDRSSARSATRSPTTSAWAATMAR